MKAKGELRSYFVKVNWPLNRNLPRGENYRTGELGDIVNKFELNRSQVARQLCNFKDEKYGNTQVKLLLEAGDLEEKMRMGCRCP